MKNLKLREWKIIWVMFMSRFAKCQSEAISS